MNSAFVLSCVHGALDERMLAKAYASTHSEDSGLLNNAGIRISARERIIRSLCVAHFGNKVAKMLS